MGESRNSNVIFWLWLVGWLFTIGYLKSQGQLAELPTFGEALVTFLAWPYLLGMAL